MVLERKHEEYVLHELFFGHLISRLIAEPALASRL